jgi:hypothetical protein
MKVQKRENNYIKLNINLDKKNYVKFAKEIQKLGKKYEYASKGKLDYSVVFNGVKTPYMETGGWANRCEDFKFVIFLDFDNSLWWQVKTQLEFLMEKFDLSPFYVFETEKSRIDCNGDEYSNYNCVCLTKRRFFEIFEIQNETTCDQAHKNLPKIYRFHSHILRNLPKGKKGRPQFKCIIGDINKEYNQPISSAHLDFLYKMYPNIPRIKYTNPDGFNKLWLSNYSTGSE